MNLLGKIFTFFILLMSIGFLLLSIMLGATHRDWKEEAETMRARSTLLERQITEVKKTTTDKEKLLDTERASRSFQLAQLESSLKLARDNYEAKEAQLQKTLSESQQRLARMDEAERRLAGQDVEVKRYQTEIAAYIDEIAAQRQIVVTIQNRINELTVETQTLSTRNQDLSEQLSNSQRILKAHDLDENSLVAHIPPRVEGIVKATRLTAGADFVAINLGSDDGLRVGHVMDVFRGDRFIGKILITKTEFDVAVGQIDPKYKKDEMVEGDRVTTKF